MEQELLKASPFRQMAREESTGEKMRARGGGIEMFIMRVSVSWDARKLA